jgi:hypothetical protein
MAKLETHPVRGVLLGPHPARTALLELIRRDGVVTATDAARELGGSTGLYSFHLRQLARYGVIEEAPAPGGRLRPWRLAETGTGGTAGRRTAEAAGGKAGRRTAEAAGSEAGRRTAGAGRTGQPGEQGVRAVSDAELGAVARGLEDESYRRWLEHREAAPGRWRQDEAFSEVAYLTPEEMAGLAEVIRALIAQYRHREDQPVARPAGAAPVAVVARLFPLLEPDAGPD